MSFANKVVIVTGASSGIGAATAILFAKEGANVVLIGRNEEKLQNILKECDENGNTHLAVIADVSKEDDAKKVIDSTVEKFGKIDVLVNNAGIVRYANILSENSLEIYDITMNTNLRAPVYLTHLAAPYLKETKGNIVNVSSIAGTKIPGPNTSYYAVSKACLNHFTRGVAAELASHGIRINTVSPGPVITDILKNSNIEVAIDLATIPTPLGRVSESMEIADLILYVASDKAKAITGSDFVSDNGYKIDYFKLQ